MAKSRKRDAAEAETAEDTGRKEKKTRKEKASPAPQPEEDLEAENSEEEAEQQQEAVAMAPTRMKAKRNEADSESKFAGEPVPPEEAKQKWPRRYQGKDGKKSPRENETDNEEDDYVQAKLHYTQAIVDGILFNLNDNAYVKAEDEQPNYIARIVELFEGVDGERYFTAQWFYRAEDTPIKDLANHAQMFDKRRVFLSEIRNINPIDCIVAKVKIAKVSPNLDLEAKEKTIPECDLYYDMKYLVPNLTFASMETNTSRLDSESSSTLSSESGTCNPAEDATASSGEFFANVSTRKSEVTLLDLYSGCGAMSTGLCIGAKRGGVNLVTAPFTFRNNVEAVLFSQKKGNEALDTNV